MNALQLPIVNPPIKGLLRWPYTLSITHGYEKTHAWYYCNFIQLACTKHFLERRLEFFFDFHRGNNNELYFNNPFFITCVSDFQTASFLNEDNLPAYFVEQIQHGYYPVVFMDEFYIPHSMAYQNFTFPHHVMLYGYDRHRRIFNVSMFDRRWIYGNHEITFDELIQAYFSMKKYVAETGVRDQQTFFYKFNPRFEYSFDRLAVTQEIRDYLNGESHLNRINFNKDAEAYGLEVYAYLQQFFQALHENHPDLVRRGITRNLHILWEHKKVMLDRLHFFAAQGIMPEDEILIRGFEQLLLKAEQMRNSVVKHFRKANEHTFTKIVADIEVFKQEEPALMERLLHALER